MVSTRSQGAEKRQKARARIWHLEEAWPQDWLERQSMHCREQNQPRSEKLGQIGRDSQVASFRTVGSGQGAERRCVASRGGFHLLCKRLAAVV